jgi:hypothetical protein
MSSAKIASIVAVLRAILFLSASALVAWVVLTLLAAAVDYAGGAGFFATRADGGDDESRPAEVRR